MSSLCRNHTATAAAKTKRHLSRAGEAIRAAHSYTDDKINEKVYGLEGLSEEEVGVVEGHSKS